MKIVILAEKPSQAKAYAEAFQIAKREKTHIELKPTNIFPNGVVPTKRGKHTLRIYNP